MTSQCTPLGGQERSTRSTKIESTLGPNHTHKLKTTPRTKKHRGGRPCRPGCFLSYFCFYHITNPFEVGPRKQDAARVFRGNEREDGRRPIHRVGL